MSAFKAIACFAAFVGLAALRGWLDAKERERERLREWKRGRWWS